MIEKKFSKQKPARNSMIKEALVDINKKILNISRKKKDLNAQIKRADNDLDNSREIEKNLQKKMAKLLEIEVSLKEKRKRISQEEDKLGDRLSKIEKVKSELNDL